jgi:hypothetical protein
LALIVVFVIAGLYFLLFHTNPWPLNHESVGLGKGDIHMVHDAIGLALFGIAGLVWWRSKRRSTQATTST